MLPNTLLLLLTALSPSTPQDQPTTIGTRLMAMPQVKAAVESTRRNEPQIIEEQVRLCEIEAPPFREQKRAAALKAAFESLGLQNVRVDEVGNVLGERSGASPRPHLVFSAHLDTVFPEGTNVRTTREGPLVKGPGIADMTLALTEGYSLAFWVAAGIAFLGVIVTLFALRRDDLATVQPAEQGAS